MRTLLSSITIVSCMAFAAVGCAQSTKQPTELSPEAFKSAVAAGKARLVDVRTPAEYAAGHLQGSVNMDWTADDYEAAFAKLDKTMPVLLYCHSGGRSEQALEYLTEQGYQAQHLAGGFIAWKKAGYESVK